MVPTGDETEVSYCGTCHRGRMIARDGRCSTCHTIAGERRVTNALALVNDEGKPRTPIILTDVATMDRGAWVMYAAILSMRGL